MTGPIFFHPHGDGDFFFQKLSTPTWKSNGASQNTSCFVFVYTGTMTAFTESAWSPSRGLNNGKDMQWGGGSLFAFEDEKNDDETGRCVI